MRGFLAWDRRDLANKAVVTIYTVERIETGAEISGTAMVKGVAAIKAALEPGIECLKIQRVESKRVDKFANMSDEELRQYVYGNKEGVSFC